MVNLSSLQGYNNASHQITEDFHLVPKGNANSICLPDDLAESLVGYIREASSEQIAELEKSISKGADPAEQLARLRGKLKKQDPDKYEKMRPLFKAYTQELKGATGADAFKVAAKAEPSTPRVEPKAAPKSTTPGSSPAELKETIRLINQALGSELKYIEDLSIEELSSFMPPVFLGSISRKEPFTETQIHRLADLMQSRPKLFAQVDKALLNHIVRTSQVLRSGTFERAAEASASGVYMGSLNGRKTIVIKPQAEELKGPYNPRTKGYLLPDGSVYQTRAPMGTAIRNGFVSGEGSLRERDAYITDLNDGLFSKTPPTLLIKVRRRPPMIQEGTSPSKICSVQAFVEGKTPKKHELPTLSQEGLERVAYADIDEGNADRHLAGNLFMTPSGDVQRIDQGMTRGPEANCCKFGWMDTYQVSRPMTELSRRKIEEQSPSIRKTLLESLGVPAKAIDLELARIQIKKSAAKAGLTFYDIGAILTPVLDRHKKESCEFVNILKRAEGSGNLQKEIDTVTASIRDWKAHISREYASSPQKATDAVKGMIDHPYVYRALARHLQILGGK